MQGTQHNRKAADVGERDTSQPMICFGTIKTRTGSRYGGLNRCVGVHDTFGLTS